ncbi:unnamed protein product [marine sediment metagenome]|uniref:Uncharacterized protein n=1 Tax=marine sediment metagenome TaxID=412755 RepID=X0WG02_9ZZZZ
MRFKLTKITPYVKTVADIAFRSCLNIAFIAYRESPGQWKINSTKKLLPMIQAESAPYTAKVGIIDGFKIYLNIIKLSGIPHAFSFAM